MRLIMLLSVLILASCGGSDSSTSASSSSFTAQGEVQSLSEQGNQFSVNGFSISVEDEVLAYGDETYPLSILSNGMIVRVVVEEGDVKSVDLLPTGVGNVDTSSGGNVQVNGVSFDSGSWIVEVGDWVMVFGHTLPDLTLEVTNISVIQNPGFAEIEGQINNLDVGAQTFNIAGITVDYSNSVVDGGSVSAGMWVEVYGEYTNNVFTARKVDPRDDDDVSGTELEGVVTWVNGEKSVFEIAGGISINVTSSTQFDDGSIENLVSGRLVEVSISNTLDALKVDFELLYDFDDSNLEFSVEGEASFTDGVVTINGFDFIVDDTTRFDDGASASNIGGAWIEVDGKTLQGTNWVKEIKLEDRDNDIDLEGVITSGVLWGYSATDSSLDQFEGKYADVSCLFSSPSSISQCVLDVN